MTGRHSVTVYGTVMETRLVGSGTLHRVEATSPGGGRLDMQVMARKRHRGSVRVAWDPNGVAEPRFIPETPWVMIGLALFVVVVIVVGGFILFA